MIQPADKDVIFNQNYTQKTNKQTTNKKGVNSNNKTAKGVKLCIFDAARYKWNVQVTRLELAVKITLPWADSWLCCAAPL